MRRKYGLGIYFPKRIFYLKICKETKKETFYFLLRKKASKLDVLFHFEIKAVIFTKEDKKPKIQIE